MAKGDDTGTRGKQNPADAPSGAEATFAAWIRDYGGIPVKVARSFAANPEDQRDLYQQMQLQIWRSIASFAAQARVSTWIYRVCLNTALTWQRTEKRRRLFVDSIRLPELWPNEKEEADPRLEALYAAIRNLPPAERALLLLYLEERSYREMAEITGLTESNVGVRLLRLKRELAERLRGKGRDDE